VIAATAGGSARIVALAAILVLAAALGLAVGTMINERAGEGRTVSGYPTGWQGGAAAPISRVATAAFSTEALDALRVTRGDVSEATAAGEESDYFQRHAGTQKARAEESDYHQRHPELTELPTRIPPGIE
jgi:hypothetical protein